MLHCGSCLLYSLCVLDGICFDLHLGLTTLKVYTFRPDVGDQSLCGSVCIRSESECSLLHLRSPPLDLLRHSAQSFSNWSQQLMKQKVASGSNTGQGRTPSWQHRFVGVAQNLMCLISLHSCQTQGSPCVCVCEGHSPSATHSYGALVGTRRLMLRRKLFETLWKRKHLNIRGENWTSHFTPFSSDLADKAPVVSLPCKWPAAYRSVPNLLIYLFTLNHWSCTSHWLH